MESGTAGAHVPYSMEDATQRWQKRCKTGCKYLQICTCNLFGGHGIGEELETGDSVLLFDSTIYHIYIHI